MKRTQIIIAGVLLLFAVSGFAGGDKVSVCHVKGNGQTIQIEIDEIFLADHLGHGDLAAECPPLQETVQYVCSTSAVAYEILYVSPDAGAAQKGTMKRPFGSISSALQFAEKRDFPGVELQIKPGVYGDDAAALSRSTRIVGPGQYEDPTVELSLSINNEGAYELGIQGVVFQAASSGPAITVANPSAETVLCNVGFESVVGHALHQTGGTVLIEDGIFNTTARDPGADSEDHLTGTAIVLNGGASGSISSILVNGSAGSGLHLSGSGTMIAVDWDGSSQSVFENGTGCLGAVVVEGGAGLIASHLTLDTNIGRGIDVEGTGTAVDLRSFVATSTQHLGGDPDLMLETCGYNAVSNVVALSGAAMDISGSPGSPFIISDSDLAGLIVQGSDPLDKTEVSLSHGVISDNVIGASLSSNGTPASCAEQYYIFTDTAVVWIGNDVNLDAPCIEPPPPLPEFFCDNGIDDDEDGLTDCADPDCTGAPSCSL